MLGALLEGMLGADIVETFSRNRNVNRPRERWLAPGLLRQSPGVRSWPLDWYINL